MTTGTTVNRWPAPRAQQLDPPPMLAELRRNDPIARITLWDGRQAWLVTRYADARRLLRDPRIAADETDPNFPSMNPSQLVPTDRPFLPRTGEPRHTAIRQTVAGRFTPKAIEKWRPFAERVAAEHVAQLLAAGPPADLVAWYAVPVPVRTIGAMAGAPDDFLAVVKEQGLPMSARAADPALPALADFRAYVQGLISRAERAPGDDLISMLVREHRAGAISGDELANLVVILLVGGQATTATMIGLGTLSLLREPALFRAIREDPAVAASAVDEFLRYHTVVADGAPRVARADVTIRGVQIRAGDAVIVSLAAANRDELAFDRPDVVDAGRTGPRHMAFGWGPHRCLGQHLARMELEIAFTTLARAVPTLRLAVPAEQLRFRPDSRLHGLLELPVAW